MNWHVTFLSKEFLERKICFEQRAQLFLSRVLKTGMIIIVSRKCAFFLLFTCAFLMPVHLAKPYIIARLDYLFQMFFFSNFKVSKEGEGLKKTWQQHFQQFRNVSAEMAAAIVAVYPSPQSLLQVIQGYFWDRHQKSLHFFSYIFYYWAWEKCALPVLTRTTRSYIFIV